MHDELIDYLSNNTNLSRFSRGEIRLLLERLAADGYELVKKFEGETETATHD